MAAALSAQEPDGGWSLKERGRLKLPDQFREKREEEPCGKPCAVAGRDRALLRALGAISVFSLLTQAPLTAALSPPGPDNDNGNGNAEAGASPPRTRHAPDLLLAVVVVKAAFADVSPHFPLTSLPPPPSPRDTSSPRCVSDISPRWRIRDDSLSNCRSSNSAADVADDDDDDDDDDDEALDDGRRQSCSRLPSTLRRALTGMTATLSDSSSAEWLARRSRLLSSMRCSCRPLT